MASTMRIRLDTTAAYAGTAQRVIFVPSDQAYYWTRVWQEGVARSMADLEAGNYTDYGPDAPCSITCRFARGEK